MKRILVALVIGVVLTLSMSSAVFAGGDKVRGDNGHGEVNQVQIQDHPQFQP